MRQLTLLTVALSALMATSLAAVMARGEGDQLKIVRWVCTDRICGGCDGACSGRGGHVAVSHRGHCACTPGEGGRLDQAIRKAFEDRAQGR